MICSKCNSEIPNGAKFCTVCGTPCAAAEPAKIFCAKCGLELAPGAKFCTSCGTPAASPVSLNKEPSADDLVAAMNTAAPASVPAPAPAPVPTPTATAVPTPVPTPTAPAASAVPQPVQAPAASVMPQPTYNNGFAPTDAPAAPQVPSYAPTSGQMPVASDASGFNGAAVAAAVVPDKVKKSPVGKIVMVIAIVLVALIGAAAGWFFSNKASFLSTFMGKPKYAAMVEKETFKEISKELDTAQLSSQIKAVSSVMGTLATNGNSSIMNPYGYGFMSDTSARAEYAPMMNNYSDNPFDGVDISGMIASYHEFMQSTYGADAISGKISLTVKDLGGLDGAEEVLDILNGTTINYNYAASSDALGAIFGAEFGNGSELDVKAVATEDGSIYLSFPFASKTGFMIKTTASGSSSDTTGTEGLDLDPDEIERLLEELVGIYTNHVEAASVTMEKGSLYVSGKEVSGKLIVADINGQNLENLFKEMFEHIANDEYFSTQIVDYINNFDDSYTISDFKNDVTDLVVDMKFDPSDKLVVRTVVNNGGKTLAKSFAIVSLGEVEVEILFADNDSETAFDFKIEGDTVLNMLNEKYDDTSGKITITVSDTFSYDPSAISIYIDYSGVEDVTYGQTEIEVGTYTVTMNVPRNSDFDDEEVELLNNSSFTIGSTVNGSTINYNIGAKINGVAEFDFNMDLTYNDDTSALSIPSDVIDITDAVNGDEPDQATQEKLQTWLGEFMTAVENSGLEEIFGASIATPTPTPTPSNPGNSDLRDKLDDLEEEVWESYSGVYTWISAYNVYNGDAYEDAMEYREQLGDLWDRVFDALYGDEEITQKKLDELTNEYNALAKDAESILQELWEASTIENAPEPTLPFNPNSGGIDPNPSGGVYDGNGNLITNPAFGIDER